MKLLNPNKPAQMPKPFPRREGVLKTMEIAGRNLMYDVNDMSLYDVEAEDTIPIASTGEIQALPILQQQPIGLCLCVSDDCNLACDYCYVWQEAHVSAGAKTMSELTVVRALDLLGRPVQPLTISFFGGEPTLAWNTIKFAVERIDMLAAICGVPVSYNITTNGTKLTPARAGFMAQHNFGAIVSVDGSRDDHDKHRRFRPTSGNAGGTYDDVVKGLHYLQAAGISKRITLRGTFVPGEWDEGPRRLAALNALCDDGLAGSVSLEPAQLECMSCSGGDKDYQPDEMQKWMDCCTDWSLARAFEGKPVHFTYLTKIVGRLAGRMPSFTECGAGAGYVSVSPDGDVHACHKRCGSIGHARWGFDEIARRQWLEPRLIAHNKCPDCWARRLCGGGCRAFNLKACGDIHEPAELNCRLLKARVRAAMRVLVNLQDDPKALALVGGPACESDCCAKQEA